MNPCRSASRRASASVPSILTAHWFVKCSSPAADAVGPPTRRIDTASNSTRTAPDRRRNSGTTVRSTTSVISRSLATRRLERFESPTIYNDDDDDGRTSTTQSRLSFHTTVAAGLDHGCRLSGALNFWSTSQRPRCRSLLPCYCNHQ